MLKFSTYGDLKEGSEVEEMETLIMEAERLRVLSRRLTSRLRALSHSKIPWDNGSVKYGLYEKEKALRDSGNTLCDQLSEYIESLECIANEEIRIWFSCPKCGLCIEKHGTRLHPPTFDSCICGWSE